MRQERIHENLRQKQREREDPSQVKQKKTSTNNNTESLHPSPGNGKFLWGKLQLLCQLFRFLHYFSSYLSEGLLGIRLKFLYQISSISVYSDVHRSCN